ncbi:MAG: serine/threonine protein kinase [Planctomycetes bacterium]|nr:serine/threonine protein kinase [Planctomycetota bacterium]
MSTNRDDRLGELCDHLQMQLDAGAAIDPVALATRFAVEERDVRSAERALRAVAGTVGPADATPRLPDDYELLGELGSGGMGVVYRARQRSLDREVAVKVLRAGDAATPQALERFEREARSLARLRHRHIVTVHEVGAANGAVFFTMDLLDGGSLAERLRQGPLPTSQAVQLLRQVGEAIAHAHGKGVLHRDLKPGNVLLDAHGDACVADLGLARELDHDVNTTRTGELLGTPAYMSPEQALGDRARVGEASDVYALGALLYECLGGEAPFAGLPLPRLMQAVVDHEPVPLRRRRPGIPKDLQTVCEQAMRKDPAARYATARAFVEDLQRFAAGNEVLARRRSLLVRAARLAHRHRVGVALAVAATATVVAVLVWLVLPGLLRDRAAAVAARLQAEGNAAGALLAMQEAYDEHDRAGIPIAARARLAGLHIDVGCDALFEDANRGAERFVDHVLAAHALTADPVPWRLAADGHPAEAAALYRQRRRLSPLVGERSLELLPPRSAAGAFAADDTNERAATLRRLWHVDTQFGTEPWTGQDRRAVLACLPIADRLPPHLRQRLHMVCCAATEAPVSRYDEPTFHAALVRLSRDPAQPRTTRRFAAALLHRTGWLPWIGARRFVEIEQLSQVETRDRQGGFFLAIEPDDDDVAWLIRCWDEVVQLDRRGAFRRRVEIVLERLGDVPPEPIAAWRQRTNDATSWVRRRTGLSGGFDDPASWDLSLPADLRSTLLSAAGWPADGAAPTLDELLRRLDGERRHEHLLHHALELTVDDDVAIPRLVPGYDRSLADRWRRSLGR